VEERELPGLGSADWLQMVFLHINIFVPHFAPSAMYRDRNEQSDGVIPELCLQF
jgi:hypothetical protein